MTVRTVVVSIDTEVDKSGAWTVATPPSFKSVVEGVPGVLSPLFDRYGTVPTYLLSPEVIEDDQASNALIGLGERAELGTHLHAQMVEPDRQLWPNNMGGQSVDDIQRQYPREIEAAKLQTLTERFTARFDRRPTSFRSGRYGSSDHTLELLAGLGYVVDSSITPGLVWRYAEGMVDHRDWSNGPQQVETPAGSIVELPVSIRPGSRLAPVVQAMPPLVRRIAIRALGPRAGFGWLRPSWARPGELEDFVAASTEPVLVAMFHSMEIVPEASPYAATSDDVARIVASIEELLRYCAEHDIEMTGMTAAAQASREV